MSLVALWAGRLLPRPLGLSPCPLPVSSHGLPGLLLFTRLPAGTLVPLA